MTGASMKAIPRRRRIIEAEGQLVRFGTVTMDQYDLAELRDAFCSVMRKGTRHEREDVIHAVASYLGFARLTDTSRDASSRRSTVASATASSATRAAWCGGRNRKPTIMVSVSPAKAELSERNR
jgi:hypothetical protein